MVLLAEGYHVPVCECARGKHAKTVTDKAKDDPAAQKQNRPRL